MTFRPDGCSWDDRSAADDSWRNHYEPPRPVGLKVMCNDCHGAPVEIDDVRCLMCGMRHQRRKRSA